MSATASVMSYHEALLHFMKADTSALRAAVKESLPPPPGLFTRLMCMGPPELRPAVMQEQLLQLLCLARVGFADAEPMHLRLLCALYASFTGAPRAGAAGAPWQSRVVHCTLQ